MKREQNNRGFTLTELMVIITVIAILAAILLPAFTRSQESSHRTECLNNVRQLGVATRLYADNNRGCLPDCTTNNPQFYGSVWPWDLNTNLTACLSNYGMQRKISYCPSNSRMDDERHWNFWKYFPQSPDRVVGYVFLLKGGVMIPPALQRASLEGNGHIPPSDAEWIVDAVASTDGDYTKIQGWLLDRTSHLIAGSPVGGNIGFLDGHAGWRDIQKMGHRIIIDKSIIWDF